MNDFPRQEESRMGQTNEIESKMAISEADVHTILAFASFVREPMMTERRTPLNNEAEPKQYAAKPRWRLAKCLDSLASICVSKEQHEVIAIAFRSSDENVEIIIAGYGDVPDETIEYIKRVWDLLRQISAALHGTTEHQKNGMHIKDKDLAADLITQFELEVVKFTYARILKKLFAKPEMIEKFDPSLPSQSAVKGIIAEMLDQILRENNENKAKARLDGEDWALMIDWLKSSSKKIEKCFPPLPSGIPRSELERYVRKIAGIGADLNNLTSAACSSHCKNIFRLTPVFTVLKKEESIITPFPATPEDWNIQMKRPLAFYNSNKAEKMRATEILQDYCQSIAGKELPRTAPVHCEVKLAIHIFKEENAPMNPKSAAYPYIGVSKLSCVGCNHFLSAFNDIHNTHFMTKGQHRKAYFPWAFPCTSCPQANKVLKCQYATLNTWFVPWFWGSGEDSLVLGDYTVCRIGSPMSDEEIGRRQRKKYGKRKLEDEIEGEEK